MTKVKSLVDGIGNEQWPVIGTVFQLIPDCYILYWVYKWCKEDNFYNRFRISEGFKWSFIISIVINVIILIVVVIIIDDLFDNEYFKNEVESASVE